MSAIISFISDASIALLLAGLGGFILFTPYDKVQDTFPKLKSKKAVKIAGGVLLFCGVAIILILLTYFYF